MSLKYPMFLIVPHLQKGNVALKCGNISMSQKRVRSLSSAHSVGGRSLARM